MELLSIERVDLAKPAHLVALKHYVRHILLAAPDFYPIQPGAHGHNLPGAVVVIYQLQYDVYKDSSGQEIARDTHDSLLNGGRQLLPGKEIRYSEPTFTEKFGKLIIQTIMAPR